MRIKGVEIEDTFAEAFDMVAGRLLITAKNKKWALQAANITTGFATSVIACGAEAGIENLVGAKETPDGRPGVNILVLAMSEKALQDQLMRRVGQCIMTCPTTACFNNLEEGEKEINIGGKLRFFGDGYQISKRIGGRRFWRIPVMEGEFLVEEKFKIRKAVGGGNFLILGRDADCVLEAAEKAVEAIKGVRNVVTPFPGGVVRSGSQVGSKYKFLRASTNIPYCPTLRSVVESKIPKGVNSVLEIVINGLDEESVKKATKVGIEEACSVDGIKLITAGNYGGKLGKHLIYLHKLFEGSR
ncbi:MAG: formylmethanofuran--tetrahydromethanopterin N-formyltransferase [Candidatus Hadarchaeaceae archaeon]